MPFSVSTDDPRVEGNSLKESATVDDMIGSFNRKTPITGSPWTVQLHTPGIWDIRGTTAGDTAADQSSESGIFIRSDGLKLYGWEEQDNKVHEYDFGTAWDLSTLSFLQTEDRSADFQGLTETNIYFRDDGETLFCCEAASNDMLEYTLGTAWDITTMSLTTREAQPVDDTIEFSGRSIWFKEDGTVLYLMNQSPEVRQFSLSTAWDITTAGTADKSINLDGNTDAPSFASNHLFFRSDGKKLFVNDHENDAIRQFDLGTAWEIDTVTYEGAYFPSRGSFEPKGVFFKPDGTMLFYNQGDWFEDSLITASTRVLWAHDTEAAVGSGYQIALDTSVSPPEFRLERLDSGTATLLDSSTTLPDTDGFFDVEVNHAADGTLTVDYGDVTLSAVDSTYLDADGFYTNHGIGFVSAGIGSLNSVDEWTQRLKPVEPWDEKGLTNWQGDTADFTVNTQSPVSQPARSLKCQTDGTFWLFSTASDDTGKPGPGDTQEILFQLQEDDLGSNGDVDFLWASDIQSTGFPDNYYRVEVSTGDSVTSDTFALFKSVNGNVSNLDLVSPSQGTIPALQWLTLRITHEVDGSFTVKLFDETGSQIASTLTATDTAHITNGEYDNENIAIRNLTRTNFFDAWILR